MPKAQRNDGRSSSTRKVPRNPASRVALKNDSGSEEDKGAVDHLNSFEGEKEEKKHLPFASRSSDSKQPALKPTKNRDESDDEKERRHDPYQHDSKHEKKPKLEPEAGIKPGDNPSQRRSVTIAGQKLHLTASFDPFWRFIVERKAIDDRRRAGMPPPWTDDPVLRSLRLCNVFRILDKTSQYIIREVIEKGSQKPKEIMFRVILFDLFTKIETFELLQRKLEQLTWETYDRSAYVKVLEKAKNSGVTLYTGAFQKPAPNRFCFKTAFENHLLLLEVLMEGLPKEISEARYLADVFEYLRSLQGMGDFNAYQLLINLSYSSVLNFSQSDFVVAGPGAHSGLSRLFGRDLGKTAPGLEIEAIRWLQATQDEQFTRLGLDFSGLGPDKLPLQIVDIEHTLCEFDRYARVGVPGSRSHYGQMQKRTASKGPTFASAQRDDDEQYPAEVYIPKAWDHPDRQKVRIKPGERGAVEKRYLVDSIVAHRKEEDGTLQYRVHWFGYSDGDDTWEPHMTLKDDAPEVVRNYLARIKTKKRR